MECSTNTAKWEQWTERFARYEPSKQTVREFCRLEGVSVPSFYNWQRKLREDSFNARMCVTDSSTTADSRTLPSAFKPILLTSVTSATVMTIRLPQGIVVELGQDRATIEQVLRQLLMHSTAIGGESC